jgi:hypothetical protein
MSTSALGSPKCSRMPSPCAHDAERVGFVNHQEGSVLALELNEAGQLRIIAIHAVDPFQHDQHPLKVVALLAEDGVQCSPVIVRERQAAGT